ncbi:MAG: hypothetical protein GC186_20620 [Rhodobacteraceae bacterium]|nr:hypothetical protein [Paracoccaceae bacterium]
MEVHYRWHPYFGQKVCVRRVEQRATGQFLQVLGPAGVVVTIAGWMVDPVICAGMSVGPPRVDLAALIDLHELVPRAAKPAHFQSGHGIAREEGNEGSQHAGTDLWPANELGVRTPQAGGSERHGAAQGGVDAGADPDASGGARRRGTQR